ncbi:MAG: outer membrane lipoprotein carrier protein LolA [Deltaproteobacteria bacterium]
MIAVAAIAAVILAAAADPAPLTPEALRARHAGARSLTAEVVQVKEGRYWARPLTSHVRLRWTPGRVEWETLDPVPSTVVIEGDRVQVVSGGNARDLGAQARDPRFAALVRFLRALAAFDLPALEGDFVLAWGPREVVATPRPGSSLSLVRKVRLVFGDDLEVRRIELESPSETTRLEFQRVERVR